MTQKKETEENRWQQFYPTYSFKDKEILLKEFELASNNVLSQEKLFTRASNFTLVTSTIIASVLGLAIKNTPFRNSLISLEFLIPLLLLLIIGSIFTTKYFADRRKSIVFDSRKIIVLRSMLGLDYGNQQLVLPKWRIEGATNPFVIKHFPGWITIATYPFWIVASFSSILLYLALPSLSINISASQFITHSIQYGVTFLWITYLMFLYRKELYDTHENFNLSIAKLISKTLSLELVDNFEYIIYRARLAKYEIQRLNIELSEVKRVLIAVEDQTFYNHNGWSFKSTVRAFLSRSKFTRKLFGIGRKSGGSTITQQLARTLFIEDFALTYKRKFVEILLARWLNKVVNKNEQVEIYLGSVRFYYGIFGLPAAIGHFFDEKPKNIELNPSKSFFLVERISNVKDRVMLERIKVLVKNLINQGILTYDDVDQIKDIYWKQVTEKGNLSIPSHEDLQKFRDWHQNWNPLHEQ